MTKTLLLLLGVIGLSACSTVPKEELNYKPYFLCMNEITGEMWSARIHTNDNNIAEVSLKTLVKNQGIMSLTEVYKSHYRIEATSKEDGVIYVSLIELENVIIKYKNLSCEKDTVN